jgi:Xaa-Pro aminopeptidase
MTLSEPFRSRVEVLRVGLAERQLDGVLVSWGPHVRYFSGVVSEWTPAFVVVDPWQVIAIVPESAGIVAGPGVKLQTYVAGGIEEIVSPRRNALVEITRVIQDRGIAPNRLGIERDHLTFVDGDAFSGLLEAVDIGLLITRQRACKDANEIARIRANLSVLETGFDAARATIQPGVTEIAVWAAMHTAMQAKVGMPFLLEGNFASGPRTLENEPHATNRRIEAADVVFIDLYPIIDGYAADLTRTFVAGRPTEAQLERHAVLKNALATGAAMLRPGVRACDVDRSVRSSVAALDGYSLPHHSGHALGLQGQERPMLIPGDDTFLQAGMVIAIEPGAYLSDTGGMRVEGNYLVTATGSESLSDYPVELFACG